MTAVRASVKPGKYGSPCYPDAGTLARLCQAPGVNGSVLVTVFLRFAGKRRGPPKII